MIVLLIMLYVCLVEQVFGSSRIIIVEDARVCFRRSWAGKRVSRNLVRRSVLCSSVQECQRICQEEKRFVCESFNYRVQLGNHRKNDCELMELPTTRLDHIRDIHHDPDYDIYEKDRDAYAECEPSALPINRNRISIRPRPFDVLGKPQDGGYLPGRYREPYPHREFDRRIDRDPYRGPDRDYSGASRNYNVHQYHHELNHEHKDHYQPVIITSHSKHYGKSYQYQTPDLSAWSILPPRQSYLPKSRDQPIRPTHSERDFMSGYEYDSPSRRPILEGDFPPVDPEGVEHKHSTSGWYPSAEAKNSKDCSTRVATGFKLHKLVVGKHFSVPDIYKCEQICFLEDDFKCSTYAYRYTKSSSTSNNCFLTDKRYKELDFYTDLEPQRDFDIYRMQNTKVCMAQIGLMDQPHRSDCFWHLRSSHSFDPSIIREALNVQSIVDCQLACLKAIEYVCRGYSFGHYEIPTSTEDNCFLTDWSFSEIKPNVHFMHEINSEIYERGSFGHGCEMNHFAVSDTRGHGILGSSTDQLCYIGYGTPARLLTSAIKKALQVNSEYDCKAECTRYRYSNEFQCMSFSYKMNSLRGSPNCYLSDILQQDLLNQVDYKPDSSSWLFAWDVYNPECVLLPRNNSISNGEYLPNNGLQQLSDEVSSRRFYDGPKFALDSWRYYTVSGWPCRDSCMENQQAGFWFCYLEGGDKNSWDYCCRPDHECGYSEGYNYEWCFVGAKRTQWRKCNDHYYPYSGQRERRIDDHFQAPIDILTQKPGYRPRLYPDHPSLNAYEKTFDDQFLKMPPSTYLGQPRLWPVSYLHHDLPGAENATEYQFDRMKLERIKAIQNLITIIKSNSTKNIEYDINNQTNLLIKIPLPGNLTANSTQASKKSVDKPMVIVTEGGDMNSNQNFSKESENQVRKRNTEPGSFRFERNSQFKAGFR